MYPPDVPDTMWGTPSRRQIFVDERSPEAFILALERRLRPGGFSDFGFLGFTERLLDRLRTDDAWLHRHGITHEQIADRLEAVIGDAERALKESHETTVVVDRFAVEFSGSFGFQECPFSLTSPSIAWPEFRQPEWCGFDGNNFTIHDPATKRSVFVPKLAIHLIRDHHFFEGNTPFRVDPEAIVTLLQIEPGR
jgi:hypothetical protein